MFSCMPPEPYRTCRTTSSTTHRLWTILSLRQDCSPSHHWPGLLRAWKMCRILGRATNIWFCFTPFSNGLCYLSWLKHVKPQARPMHVLARFFRPGILHTNQTPLIQALTVVAKKTWKQAVLKLCTMLLARMYELCHHVALFFTTLVIWCHSKLLTWE